MNTHQQILKKQHAYQQFTMQYVEVPYKYRDFPKWKYRAGQKPALVNNPEEEKALGPGWQDKPTPNTAPTSEEALRSENEEQKKQLATLQKT